MMTDHTVNRIVLALMVLTVGMSAIGLYRQGRGPSRPTPQTVRQAGEDTVMDIKGLPIDGNTSAKVVLIEFSDYECPFCAKHVADVGTQIKKEFMDTGKISHVFVNNPLPIHSNARLLANASFCAQQQNAFWKMYQRLFEVKPKSKEELSPIVEELGLDSVSFGNCVEADSARVEIDHQLKIAEKFQLTGTPSFAIGIVQGDERVTIDRFLLGALPFATFKQHINAVLEKA